MVLSIIKQKLYLLWVLAVQSGAESLETPPITESSFNVLEGQRYSNHSGSSNLSSRDKLDPYSGSGVSTVNITVKGLGTRQCVATRSLPTLSFPMETERHHLITVSGPTTGSFYEDLLSSWLTTTFSEATSIYTTDTRQKIPQLQSSVALPNCCGKCVLYLSMVDVHYWPVAGAPTACTTGSSNVTSKAVLPSNSVGRRFVSIGGNHSTVVSDGFTFTSPSIYVAYHDISASDRCGQVGEKHTSITMSFAPGELSSLESDIITKVFNQADIPCPPRSLIESQSSFYAAAFWDGRPNPSSYVPVIAPPPALQGLDPAWGDCIQWSWQGFDPPRLLTSVPSLGPTTTLSEDTKAIPTPAMPCSTPYPGPTDTALAITAGVSSAEINTSTSEISVHRVHSLIAPLPTSKSTALSSEFPSRLAVTNTNSDSTDMPSVSWPTSVSSYSHKNLDPPEQIGTIQFVYSLVTVNSPASQNRIPCATCKVAPPTSAISTSLTRGTSGNRNGSDIIDVSPIGNKTSGNLSNFQASFKGVAGRSVVEMTGVFLIFHSCCSVVVVMTIFGAIC